MFPPECDIYFTQFPLEIIDKINKYVRQYSFNNARNEIDEFLTKRRFYILKEKPRAFEDITEQFLKNQRSIFDIYDHTTAKLLDQSKIVKYKYRVIYTTNSLNIHAIELHKSLFCAIYCIYYMIYESLNISIKLECVEYEPATRGYEKN